MDFSDPPHDSASPWKTRAWFVLKWGLCAAIVYFVVRRAQQLTSREELSNVSVCPGWLVLAGLTYAIGWIPSVWFWQRLLRRSAGRVGWRDLIAAYSCGHLGKYIPGKATVLLMRSTMLRGRGTTTATAAVTAAVETLLMMGAGAVVALALAPRLLSAATINKLPEFAQPLLKSPWLLPLLVAIGCAVALPLIAKLLSLLSLKMTPDEMRGEVSGVRITVGFIAGTLATMIAGWVCFGLSLGCVLASIDAAAPLSGLLDWSGAAALATVAGFVALVTPGGIGIREGILLETLSGVGVSPSLAIVAALLLRGVWLATEIVAAGGLYWLRPNSRSQS